MSEYKYSTLAVHAGQYPDPLTGAVNVPVYLSSTFELTGIGTDRGWDYSRAGNPTRDRLEEALAALEGGTCGHAFASGMAAIYALVATLKAGDHLICSHNVYGGTQRLFNLIIQHYGIEIEYVDTGDLDAVAKAIKPNTKLMHVETPTNPLMSLTDIAAVSEIAHARGVEVSVDGLGGALIGSKPEHKERFLLVQKAAGGILSPFECFLVLRGIKTLPLRMKQHEENGRAVAEFLATQTKLTRLAYPGLKSHPQHEAAEGLWVNAEFRPGHAGCGGAVPGSDQAVPERGVAGRCGVAGLALGNDDARGAERSRSRAAGDYAGAGQAVGGD